MKNPANPGDFGTNGTRGVVGSGMSETTKRTLGADLIDLSVPWAERIDRTHLASRLSDQQPRRASTFGAEGGVKRETTNSASENGTGCTGRKMALITMVIFCALLVEILVILVSRTGWVIGLLLSAVVYAGGFLLAVLTEMAWGRASGGEGV